MAGCWRFYGRHEELGGLLQTLRRGRWFFGAIRGRRRIGKTALLQQALQTLSEDESAARRTLLVQLPDSNPADFAAVFRNALQASGHQTAPLGGETIQGLTGVAEAVGSLCANGAIVALDEFQICRSGPLSAFPSLIQAQVDRLQDMDTPGGLIVLGSVQSEMEALLADRAAPLYGRTTFRIHLEPWDLRSVFEVCGEHGAQRPFALPNALDSSSAAYPSIGGTSRKSRIWRPFPNGRTGRRSCAPDCSCARTPSCGRRAKA